MSTISPAQRVAPSPAVRAILEAGGPKSQFLKQFLHYMAALLAPDVTGLDNFVTPDGRFHELEAMGLPPGREGLKLFRRQVNAAIPDEHVSVIAVRFEGDDIIEADLVMSATQTGKFSASPQPAGKFASRFTSAADLWMASWPNDGRKWTWKPSSASSPAPFSKPHEEDLYEMKRDA